MNITLTKDFRCLKSGQVIEIKPNEVNCWVGLNGTGKSTAVQLILTILNKIDKNLIHKRHWFSQIVGDTTCASLSGFDDVKRVFYTSDKTRQTQFVDLDALEGQFFRLQSSEGQNNLADLHEAVAFIRDPNALIIFDELDGKLDTFNKLMFFDYLLPRVKATTIVITHDAHMLGDKQVFDFTDKTSKPASHYYDQCRANLIEAHKAFSSK